ncbi:hypothetical protein SKAU_G00326680 [Synaphobranchus kaupii]|uniref:Uncharacterized protein n=1 Tax=Synaphobranchus kaupii TaxID=118154 RepID=A0A9Q1EPQ0_SYNKA|nr:hypothetical protein SKAU_G00326680 [Synaphobranchus kaupii]
MDSSTKLSGSSLLKSQVIGSENSVQGQKGRRQPHGQPRVSRDRDDVQTPESPDPIVPPKSRSYQDKSGTTYRGGCTTKMRQPNIAGKRSCLPLAQWLLDDMLQDLVREVTVATLQKCTRDFVDAYLAEVAIRRCASDIISEMVELFIPGLVEEVLREKVVDDVIEAELLPEVLVEEARAVALSELARCESQVTIKQLSQVRQYASSRLMDVFLMDCLLKLVASKGPCFTEKEQSGRLLDSWMLDVLFHQLFSVLQHRDITVENIPLRNYHRRVFTDIALDVILSEFCQSLDEDMEHWLEFERLIEEGVR